MLVLSQCQDLLPSPLALDHPNHLPTASTVQPVPCTPISFAQQSEPMRNKKQIDVVQSSRHRKPPPPLLTQPPTPDPIAGNAVSIATARTTSLNKLTDTSEPGKAVANTTGRMDEIVIAQTELVPDAQGPVCRFHVAMQSAPTATTLSGQIYSPEV